MKDENKKFLQQEDFYKRVKNIMVQRGITTDTLYSIITKEIGYDIAKNNLNLYLQRVPNVNFLIALSKALNISTDYLLGIDSESPYETGFNYKYESKKYKKYEGEYHFYFYPTVSNSPTNVQKAHMSITLKNDYHVKLLITADINRRKEYNGKLLLSDSYEVGYISLKGKGFGEMVYISFCDPSLNFDNAQVQFIIGAMLSISSGDLKRVPVMSRCILCRPDIDERKFDGIKAHLKLNTKYINITQDNIKKSLDAAINNYNLRQEILNRLQSAFKKKEYYVIEESFIINTLLNDYDDLTKKEIMELLNNMRLHSLSNANSKINKTVDTRLYQYLINDCLDEPSIASEDDVKDI